MLITSGLSFYQSSALAYYPIHQYTDADVDYIPTQKEKEG